MSISTIIFLYLEFFFIIKASIKHLKLIHILQIQIYTHHQYISHLPYFYLPFKIYKSFCHFCCYPLFPLIFGSFVYVANLAWFQFIWFSLLLRVSYPVQIEICKLVDVDSLKLDGWFGASESMLAAELVRQTAKICNKEVCREATYWVLSLNVYFWKHLCVCGCIVSQKTLATSALHIKLS